jgi:hypothetical protein
VTPGLPGPGTLGGVADADAPEALSNKDLKALAMMMLAREGGVVGIMMAVAPTVVFFVVNTLSSLRPALVASVAVAVLALCVQLIRRRPLRQAVAGFVLVGASASVAALTGQAKGYFLLGTVGTGAAAAGLILTVLVGRPLAGWVLNHVVHGQPDWRRNRRPLRVYSAITLAWGVLNAVFFGLHVWFYLVNLTAALAVMSVTGPPTVVLVLAASVLVARRAMPRDPAPAT